MVAQSEMPRCGRRVRFASLAVAILGSAALAGCASPPPAAVPVPTHSATEKRIVVTDDYTFFMQARIETKLDFIADTCVGLTGLSGAMTLAVLPRGSHLEQDGDRWLLFVPTVEKPIVIGADTVVAGGGGAPWGAMGTSDETVPAECRTEFVAQFVPENYTG